MKLTAKAMWGIGIALSFLMATPATAGWINPAGKILLDLDIHPSPGVATNAYEDDITDAGLVTIGDLEGSDAYEYEIGIGPPQIDTIVNVSNSGTDEIDFQAPDQLVADVNGDGTQISQVPEPATLALVAFGLGGLGWRSRRSLER
jgi:hypothetical protein